MNHVATKAWVLAGVAGGMVTAIGLALLFARLFLVALPSLIRPPLTLASLPLASPGRSAGTAVADASAVPPG